MQKPNSESISEDLVKKSIKIRPQQKNDSNRFVINIKEIK